MAEEEDDIQVIKVAGLILGVLIMAENFLVVVTVFINKKLHTTTYVYIANLAIADTLAGFMFIFMYTGGLEFSVDHKTIWFLKYGGTIVTLTASICSLLSIAIDRCIELSTIAVHSHLGDPKRRRRCIAALSVSWLVSIAIGSLPLLGWHCLNDGECSGTYNGLSRNYLRFALAVELTFLVAIYVLYVLIYRHVVKTASEVAQHVQDQDALVQMERQTRLQKTLFTVLGIFTVCWLPFLVLVFVDCVCATCQIDEPFDLIIPIVALINSGMNPVIYALRSKDMRSTYIFIICCCGKGQTPSCACLKRQISSEDSSTDRRNRTSSWLETVWTRLSSTASLAPQPKWPMGEVVGVEQLAPGSERFSSYAQKEGDAYI